MIGNIVVVMVICDCAIERRIAYEYVHQTPAPHFEDLLDLNGLSSKLTPNHIAPVENVPIVQPRRRS